MTRKNYAAAVICISLLTTSAVARKKPQVSGLELQQIQSKDFEVGKDITFPAVMSVLQDSGYRIQAGNFATGLITGVASTRSHLAYGLIFGATRKKMTPVVSAYIEDRGPKMSRVRLNFVMSKTKANFAGKSEDEEPITDAATYREAFEKIDKAIFIRVATDAPAPTTASTVTVKSSTSAVGVTTSPTTTRETDSGK